MAEEAQNLVQHEVPEQNVVEVGSAQPRTLTCNKNTGITVLSVFVGLLLAGQAASVYFISQQHATIQELSAATTALKLKDMIRNLPGSPPSQKRQKLRIASFSIPLAFSDTDGSTPNLEKIAEQSNKIEDAAKYWLLRMNPLRTYPTLNGTILENLRKLKQSLSDPEWMVFDAWMQQWYLFNLVQTTETPNPTPQPTKSGNRDFQKWWQVDYPQEGGSPSGNLVYASPSYSSDSEPSPFDEIPSGAYMTSDCLEKARVKVVPGTYQPQCDDNGDYMDEQCWRSTGYCWCVYKNGTEVPETRSRARIDCTDIQVPINVAGEADMF